MVETAKLPESEQRKKIEIVQVMRGIAALGIVYFHTEYGPWESANWGVDFFFILSGYFLMMSTETYTGGGGYWENKLIKICPLYYIMTFVVAIGWFIIPDAFRSTIVNFETLIKSLLFLPCYSANEHIYPVYSVGWTLNMEMFFYLIAFAALKINHKYRGAIISGTIVLLTAFGITFAPEQVALKFWTSLRMIDFVAGICLFKIRAKIHTGNTLKREGHLICLISIGISLACLFFGKYILKDNFSFEWNTLWGSVLLFVCVYFMEDVKCNKWLVLLGNMSYSIYMVHFLIVGFVCRLLMRTKEITAINTLVVIGTIIAVLLCAWIAHQIFEVKLTLYIKKKIKTSKRPEVAREK